MVVSLNGWMKYKSSDVSKKKNGKNVIFENSGSAHGYFIKPQFFTAKDSYVKIGFHGSELGGNGATVCVHDLKHNLLGEFSLNTESILSIDKGTKFFLSIKIHTKSKAEITGLSLEFVKNNDEFINNFGKSDTLVITPSYPTPENKYFGGFVHSRLKAYKEAGIQFDVACCHYYNGDMKYSFEGVDVLRLPFADLRSILRIKKYKRVLVHFFDHRYAQVLDSTDLSETEIYLWVHGPETLYWDWPKFMTNYFKEEYKITDYDRNIFNISDALIKRYNEKTNVTWVFVSNWIKERSEELINIKFNKYTVIPNIIDEKTFNYVPKDPEQRKKIFFVRRFDNIDKYAIDVNVRTIMALSRRPCFNDLEFNIYGTGDLYAQLIDPIKDFPNVHLYPRFLSHDEIAAVHKENGLALFATRYDAQGVSMCEAAMSGLVIIGSENGAVREFIPNDVGILAPTEDYEKYADNIERIYNNPDEFTKLSLLCHEKVAALCSSENTIEKEIELFSGAAKGVKVEKIRQADEVILSVIIPSYNVSSYLRNGISTIVGQPNASKLEVIIVNDGSKDDTADVAREIIDKWCDPERPIIKLIDKENGGHGSTINVGIRSATGKYVRIIDGDDWVNSEDFSKLIDRLEEEDSDIVVTDYCEDIATQNMLIERKLYQFMKVGKKYDLNDVCNKYYGFQEWGPILATGNFKTEMLKKLDFMLSEKSFYVDMEFDIFSILDAATISYYDYDIYRYFIGRAGQSVSQESFCRNRFQHEKILLRMIEISNGPNVSPQKKDYIDRLLITPVIKAHYIIVAEYRTNQREFVKFDKKLKAATPLYSSPEVTTLFLRFHRMTHGLLLFCNPVLKWVNKKIRRGNQ